MNFLIVLIEMTNDYLNENQLYRLRRKLINIEIDYLSAIAENSATFLILAVISSNQNKSAENALI